MEEAFNELKSYVVTALSASAAELEHQGANISNLLRKSDSIELKIDNFVTEFRLHKKETHDKLDLILAELRDLKIPFDRRPTVKMPKLGY